jgi:hypothetical protein
MDYWGRDMDIAQAVQEHYNSDVGHAWDPLWKEYLKEEKA